MRVDSDDETEDQFEMPLEDLSDPVQSIEPPPTTSSCGCRRRERKRGVANAEGRRAYAKWLPVYRTRSRTGSLGRGGPKPPPAANPDEGGPKD